MSESKETESLFAAPGLKDELAKMGVHLLTIPAPESEELHRLQGWRDGIEKYGQELWGIYHWVAKAQEGTHGIYRLRDWLEQMNVPDNTDEATRGEFPRFLS